MHNEKEKWYMETFMHDSKSRDCKWEKKMISRREKNISSLWQTWRMQRMLNVSRFSVKGMKGLMTWEWDGQLTALPSQERNQKPFNCSFFFRVSLSPTSYRPRCKLRACCLLRRREEERGEEEKKEVTRRNASVQHPIPKCTGKGSLLRKGSRTSLSSLSSWEPREEEREEGGENLLQKLCGEVCLKDCRVTFALSLLQFLPLKLFERDENEKRRLFLFAVLCLILLLLSIHSLHLLERWWRRSWSLFHSSLFRWVLFLRRDHVLCLLQYVLSSLTWNALMTAGLSVHLLTQLLHLPLSSLDSLDVNTWSRVFQHNPSASRIITTRIIHITLSIFMLDDEEAFHHQRFTTTLLKTSIRLCWRSDQRKWGGRQEEEEEGRRGRGKIQDKTRDKSLTVDRNDGDEKNRRCHGCRIQSQWSCPGKLSWATGVIESFFDASCHERKK